MSSITKHNLFVDTGEYERGAENFQYVLFKDFRQDISSSGISFERSDFRGARIEGCAFANCNFSNTDFISSYIVGSEFSECSFSNTTLDSTYLKSASFRFVNFELADIVRSTFSECHLSSVGFRAATLREIEFRATKFTECDFSMATAEDIKFINCDVSNVDFSPITCTNFQFIDCNTNNLQIDPDYLGTYLFDRPDISSFSMKYRGRKLQVSVADDHVLRAIAENFLTNGRNDECFNIIIQYLGYSERKIVEIFKYCFEPLLSGRNIADSNRRINNIFRSVLFFSQHATFVSYQDCIDIFDYCQTRIECLGANAIELALIENTAKLKWLLENQPAYWRNTGADVDRKVRMEFYFDESDEVRCLDQIDSYFSKLTEIAGLAVAPEKLYKITSIRKGSTIIEVVTYMIPALLFVRLFPSAICSVVIDYAKTRKMVELIGNANTTKELLRVNDIKIGASDELMLTTTTKLVKLLIMINKGNTGPD